MWLACMSGHMPVTIAEMRCLRVRTPFQGLLTCRIPLRQQVKPTAGASGPGGWLLLDDANATEV